jgi:ADP-ribose pyrophosphatase
VITQHQQEAISKYIQFQQAYPKLFSPRSLRRLVTDRRSLETYADDHGEVLGLVAETQYAYFVVDLVEKTNHDGAAIRFPYFRLIYRKQLDGAVNTVVIGTVATSNVGAVDSVVLLRQERHATGLFHLELPRGFGEAGLSGEENALKELREETGYLGEQAKLIGVTYTDTGVMDARVSFYHVPVTGKLDSRAESEEAITDVQLMSMQELWEGIHRGDVTDGFTVQALAFLRA